MQHLSFSISPSLSFMFICSFLTQYFLMSWIMADSTSRVTYSLGKFYLSTIMGLLMVIIEWWMMSPLSKFSPSFFLPLLAFLLLTLFFIYLYRNQTFIGDKEYLKEMIEHHSMAILTSEQILEKKTSPEVANLAKNIITNQTKEIEQMEHLSTK